MVVFCRTLNDEHHITTLDALMDANSVHQSPFMVGACGMHSLQIDTLAKTTAFE